MLDVNYFSQSSLNAPLPINEIYMAETNILRVQCNKQFFVYQTGVAVPSDVADILKVISVLLPAEVFNKERIRQSQVSKVIQNYFAMIQEELSLVLAKYESTFNLNLVFSLREGKCTLKDIDLYSYQRVFPNIAELASIISDDIEFIISKRGSGFEKEDFSSLFNDAKNYLLTMAVEWEDKNIVVAVEEKEDIVDGVISLSSGAVWPKESLKDAIKFSLGEMDVYSCADFFHPITQNGANLFVKGKAELDAWFNKLSDEHKEILRTHAFINTTELLDEIKNNNLSLTVDSSTVGSIKTALVNKPEGFANCLASVLTMCISYGENIDNVMMVLSAFLPIVNPESAVSYKDKTLFLDFNHENESVISIQIANVLPSEKIQRLVNNAAKSVSVDVLKSIFPNKTVTNTHLKMAVASKPKELKAFKDIAGLFR